MLCNRLAQHGFDVCNWEYPSLSQGVPGIAEMLRNDLTAARMLTGSRPIHVVAYSREPSWPAPHLSKWMLQTGPVAW